MTGYTVHTGASKKFVSGWDKVFGGATKPQAAEKTTKKSAAARGKKNKKK